MTPAAKPLGRFARLPPGRQTALLRAVAERELTLAEIALAFGVSRNLVGAAARMLDMGASGNTFGLGG